MPTPGSTTHVTEPVVVFEILSPGTSRTDRITKSREYRDMPSIQRYVMLEEDAIAATVFHKQNDDWIGHTFFGETDLPLPKIDITIPLAELNNGVELATDPTEHTLPQEIPVPRA